MTIKTAVTAVQANSSAAPVRASKGRPALVLKGGVLYKDAKAAAKTSIKSAKADVAASKAQTKILERNVKAAEKNLAAANKALVDVQAKPAPDKPVQRGLVAAATAAIKVSAGEVKNANKAIEVHGKSVAKLIAIHEKAIASLTEVEAAKQLSVTLN